MVDTLIMLAVPGALALIALDQIGNKAITGIRWAAMASPPWLRWSTLDASPETVRRLRRERDQRLAPSLQDVRQPDGLDGQTSATHGPAGHPEVAARAMIVARRFSEEARSRLVTSAIFRSR